MKVKHFEENKLGTDYVAGDIHGCFDKLREELKAVGFDETKDRLFSVGDLVDRGPQSEEALDWLAFPWFHAVRGNHEQMTIDLMNHGEGMYDRHNGMGWILDMPKSKQKLFADAFEELPYAIDIKVGDKLYGIIHAEVAYNDWTTLEESLDGNKSTTIQYAALWNRDKFNAQDKTFVEGVELVYVGHTPLKQVEVLGNVIYIDTGACFKGGSLTILEIY